MKTNPPVYIWSNFIVADNWINVTSQEKKTTPQNG